MSRRGSSIDYTAHMYSIQAHTSMRSRKAQQDGTWRAGRRRLIGLALPSGPRGVGRGRADEPPAACRCALASEPRAARAWGARRLLRGPHRSGGGGRGGSLGCSGWPWPASAGTPGRAALDGPGAAPSAGGGQSTRLSPSCQRGQRKPQGSWPGCQLRLCRVASHCCRELGALPLTTPGRRSPSRVGVCGKGEGPHCGAVQGKARAAELPRVAGGGGWRRSLASAARERAPRPGH
jgi:hypothetical protein